MFAGHGDQTCAVVIHIHMCAGTCVFTCVYTCVYKISSYTPSVRMGDTSGLGHCTTTSWTSRTTASCAPGTHVLVICAHAYTRVSWHPRPHFNSYTYAPVCVPVYVHVDTHAYVHVYVHAYAHAYVHAYAHIYARLVIMDLLNWSLF